MIEPIYFDNNATTGLDPRVLNAMLPHLSPKPANPSSIHFLGREAKAELSIARETIASYFSVKPNELIFTSGGTESLNIALRGLLPFPTKGHIITTTIEHSAVFNTTQQLQSQGHSVTYIPTSSWGAARPSQVEEALRPETKLIALTAVNSETGVKTDIEAIAALAKQRGISFIVDGVALLGKEPFPIVDGISAMAFSAHKLHGPKGVGLLFIRSSAKLHPVITGGDQEYGKRSGTENLAGIVGLAAAIQLLKEELPPATSRMKLLRDHFEQSLLGSLGNVLINGEGPRVVNTSNLCFTGVDGEALLMSLDLKRLAASHGSACASGTLAPSRVLLNMGLDPRHVRSSLRFSLSRLTTKHEIDRAIEIIVSCVQRLR